MNKVNKMLNWTRRNATALSAHFMTFVLGVLFGAGLTVFDLLVRGL